ncbi:MAG: glycosyltransferase family 4 protein [Bacteroidota bacterium]
MKLLVVDHNAVDPLQQGTYRHLAETFDITTRVIAPALWHDNYRLRRVEARSLSQTCDLVPLPVLFATRTHRHWYRGLARQVKEFAPDVLYVNAEPENFQTFQCAALAGRRPLVFSTWRNIDHANVGYPYRLSSLHAAIERSVLRRARHGVAFTQSAADIFIGRGYNRITVIPPEVDTELFHQVSRQDHEQFTVGYAGRLEAGKGVDILLDAVAHLPPEVRLVIIGSGRDERRLKERSEALGIARRVEFRAPVARRDMPQQYGSMDVLVLPSRSGRFWREQYGRVLIEAMACGVPVIGSDSGEIPQVVGDAGLIFQEGNSGELRDALDRLRNDASLRVELARRGREVVMRRNSLERAVEAYGQLFMRVAAET